MKKRYLLFPVCILVLWLCAAISNTIDTYNTPAVIFTEPIKSRIEFTADIESTLCAEEIYRMRSPADLILEDIYVMSGDYVSAGTPIASVYAKALDRTISTCTDMGIRDILLTIRNQSYQITAPTDMCITEVCITEDCHVSEDVILYKYAPTGCEQYSAQFLLTSDTAKLFQTGASLKYSCMASAGEKEHVYTGKTVIRHIEDGLITCIFEDAAGYRHGDTVTVSFTYKSEQYDSVVPFDVLYESSDSQYTNMYTIYYAVPIPDEPDRYTVVQGTVKVLETNGVYAAIEYRYTDGRKIIRHMDGNVTHGSTVRERN